MAKLAIQLAVCCMALCVHIAQASEIPASYKEISRFQTFDHIETGFALTGSHKSLACHQCHRGSQIEKLPHRCDACHDNTLATGMPQGHLPSSEPCDICHTTLGFKEQIDMDHRYTNAACVFCHDGYSQTGKPLNHIKSSNDCRICHESQAWKPLRDVNHSALSDIACDACHNQEIARGREQGTHIHTTTDCEACHSRFSSNWRVSRIDHDQVLGLCADCHNNVTARGPGHIHVPIIQSCDSCHGVDSWGGVHYSHEHNGTMRCTACHDGVQLAGKPINHVKSSDECEHCHDSDISWNLVRQFDHGDIVAPCRECHQLPAGHVMTGDDCEICHQTMAWSLVYVRHLSLQASACRNCHDNNHARGKPARHCASDDDCEECHSVNSWRSTKHCPTSSNEGRDSYRFLKQ